jgi:hypothetical protein
VEAGRICWASVEAVHYRMECEVQWAAEIRLHGAFDLWSCAQSHEVL